MKKTHRVAQGDSFKIQVPLYLDGELSPVAGWSFWMTVKADLSAIDGAALFQKKTADASIVPWDETSVFVLGDPEDTKDATPGRYEYDIQGKSPEGEIHTLETGYFWVDPEVTKAA